MSSRTAEELKNRLSQIENMTSVISDVHQKTLDLETKNRELLERKTELAKKLEIKSGRLEFILDEKENLFSKLQKIMELNQKLKKEENKKKPKAVANKKGWFKGGWFSGVKDYFKKKDLETIDVSDGKVRKNIKDNGEPMGIDEQFENTQSFFTNKSDEDISALRKKRVEKNQTENVEKNQKKKEPEPISKFFISNKIFYFHNNRISSIIKIRK